LPVGRGVRRIEVDNQMFTMKIVILIYKERFFDFG
jgi:hypothetical protein